MNQVRTTASAQDPTEGARRRMVETQIRNRGIRDPRVLAAMLDVPRHRFVPTSLAGDAYADHPLAIGWGQTISQPYIVASMTELLEPRKDFRVLEIGTGSGYHAAVLSRLVADVYTIEIVEPLAKRAAETLRELGYTNVHTRHGDGYNGWPEAAPFDAIVLTAAPPSVPQPLLDQLKMGGKMVLPLGREFQDLVVLTKTDAGITRSQVSPVRFVPMTGRIQKLAGP